MTEANKNHGTEVPPYVSFATFLNALEGLAEHGVPAQIDRSVLGKFSGSVQRQLISAFRYLGFTDEKDHPTDKLKDYEKADKEKRKALLGIALKDRFPEQVKILPNGTQKLLHDSFDSIQAETSVKKKCITFMLQAAKEAGYQISTHLLRTTRTGTPRKPAVRKPTKPSTSDHTAQDDVKDGEKSVIPEGMVAVPIALGPQKVWKVIVEKDYMKEDVDRFIKVIEIVLGKA